MEEVFVLCFLREMIEIIIDFLRAFSKKLYFFVYSIQKGKSYFIKNKKVENKFFKDFSKKLYLTKKLYFFVYSIQKGKSYFVKNKKVENKFFKDFSKKLYLTKKLYFFV